MGSQQAELPSRGNSRLAYTHTRARAQRPRGGVRQLTARRTQPSSLAVSRGLTVNTVTLTVRLNGGASLVASLWASLVGTSYKP